MAPQTWNGSWLSLFVLALAIDTATADTIKKLKLDGTGGWEASWTDQNLTLMWDRDLSVLTKMVTFKDLKPISIIFEDKEETTQELFITVKDSAKNNTNVDWADFLFTLHDFTAVGNIRGLHPSYTHFHTHRAGAMLQSNPLVYQAGGDNLLPSQDLILLGLGSPVKIGQALTANNFKIHAREADKFEFSEQPSPVPIPEPSSLTLMVLGMLGLLARYRSCRKERRSKAPRGCCTH